MGACIEANSIVRCIFCNIFDRVFPPCPTSIIDGDDPKCLARIEECDLTIEKAMLLASSLFLQMVELSDKAWQNLGLNQKREQ